MTLLEQALLYWDAGFNVIPANGKVPAVDWKEFQTQRAERIRIERYFTNHPKANVGFITGPVSGIMVVDFDIKHTDPDYDAKCKAFLDDYRSPLMVRTGSGGFHVYYKHCEGARNATKIHPRHAIDIRADGGFAVLPPSIHPTTHKAYEWYGAEDFDLNFLPELVTMLPELPQDIFALLHFQRRSKLPEDWRRIVYNTKQGERNNNVAAILGKFMGLMRPQEWHPFLMPLIEAWNEKYVQPPLTTVELQNVFDSMAKIEYARRDTMKPYGDSNRKTEETTALAAEPTAEGR